MDTRAANKIIDGYVNWWRAQFEVYQAGEGVRILSPMLDRHNDYMSIYLSEVDSDSEKYILTDMGATLGDLVASGCDITTKVRASKIENVLMGYGITRVGKELYVETFRDKLFDSLNMLMQTMATIDDLYFTLRDTKASSIADEIGCWLDDNDVRYSTDIKLTGKSGFETKFDFLIAGSRRNNIAERYIKAVNSPQESSVKNALFGWSDINVARENSESFLFMNTQKRSKKDIPGTVKQACENYDVVPVSWNGVADDVILRRLAA